MKKYLNPDTYLNKITGFANDHMLNRLESIFAPASTEPLRHPPIFILGAPRSGSTLAIQAIVDAIDVGYISNFHCRWYGAPGLAQQFSKGRVKKEQSNYSSIHGATSGASAPAECGQWWYRFFPREPAYVVMEEVDTASMDAFRRSLGYLTKACDRPVLIKNLYASLRLRAIARFIPESLYIVIHRDEVDNGHSLLETRMQVFGQYEKWWSMEPPGIENLKTLPIYKQVIEQIRQIHSTISEDLRNAGVSSERVFHLQFEEFCEDTHLQIESLCKFLQKNGCGAGRIGNPPRQFPRRSEIRIDRELYRQMKNYASSV